MANKKILVWELIGILLISLAGSAFHFIFEWSHFWNPVALFGAVNESTWEHLKIAFWPALLFAVIEYPFLRKNTNNFFPAKAAGLFLMPLTITVLFYLYTAIIHDNLPMDITIFVIAVAVGQWVSYKLLTHKKMSQSVQNAGVTAGVLLIAAFSLLTFVPPHIFLFQDPNTSTFGIPQK